MRQSGGIEFKSIEPYRLVTIRESRIATTPRSSIDLINLPVPCANKSAALGNETSIKPEPPASSTSFARAEITGSSGLGNGIRSIATRVQDGPGTSTPCQRLKVPRRIEVGSSAKQSV